MQLVVADCLDIVKADGMIRACFIYLVLSVISQRFEWYVGPIAASALMSNASVHIS